MTIVKPFGDSQNTFLVILLYHKNIIANAPTNKATSPKNLAKYAQ
jgi:hypothetical protein